MPIYPGLRKNFPRRSGPKEKSEKLSKNTPDSWNGAQPFCSLAAMLLGAQPVLFSPRMSILLIN